MKIINKLIMFSIALLVLNACVKDDHYTEPSPICSSDSYTANTTIADLKAMYTIGGDQIEITDDLVLEGYVVSSDESGNIYKTIYIQDALENPTQGLSISTEYSDNYVAYPIGSKLVINLKGLYLTEYGGVMQLGGSAGRISREETKEKILKTCDEEGSVVPKKVEIPDFSDDLLGQLVQLENVQFGDSYLCGETYALANTTNNVSVYNCNGRRVILRNSGYSDFADESLPAGNGTLTGILSKYVSNSGTTTWQMYIRDTDDVQFAGERCNGETVSCTPPADNASIADLKAQYTGSLTQIDTEMNVEATITANDIGGNFYKQIYVEDETGGIQIKINLTDINLRLKYQLGKKITIAAKDLYIGEYGGELQLGEEYNGSVGRIDDDNLYKYIFSDGGEATALAPTAISITEAASNYVGMLVKFSDVEFVADELGNSYAPGSTTNRTFEDCSGNTMVIRTSSYADFANEIVASGRGTLTGILSVYNGTYQLYLRDGDDVQLTEETRCDGTVPAVSTTVYSESFATLDNWTAISITGDEAWEASSYGGDTFAKISGYSGGNHENEDWLVSNAIAIPSTAATAILSFDTAKNYSGDDLEVYYTTNYTGDVTTTTWTQLSPTLSSGSWTFTNSGDLDVSTTIGGNLYIAFKYTSSTSSGATWEVNNVEVKTTE